MAAPKKAVISGATGGNNTLVAAVSGKKIRVLAMSVSAAAAVTLTLQSGAGGTALSGAMTMATGIPIVWPYNEKGWVETAAGSLLNMALGGAVQVSGVLLYEEVS